MPLACKLFNLSLTLLALFGLMGVSKRESLQSCKLSADILPKTRKPISIFGIFCRLSAIAAITVLEILNLLEVLQLLVILPDASIIKSILVLILLFGLLWAKPIQAIL